jgi:hypothetical protein
MEDWEYSNIYQLPMKLKFSIGQELWLDLKAILWYTLSVAPLP